MDLYSNILEFFFASNNENNEPESIPVDEETHDGPGGGAFGGCVVA
jgi:hypothetical protein